MNNLTEGHGDRHQRHNLPPRLWCFGVVVSTRTHGDLEHTRNFPSHAIPTVILTTMKSITREANIRRSVTPKPMATKTPASVRHQRYPAQKKRPNVMNDGRFMGISVLRYWRTNH